MSVGASKITGYVVPKKSEDTNEDKDKENTDDKDSSDDNQDDKLNFLDLVLNPYYYYNYHYNNRVFYPFSLYDSNNARNYCRNNKNNNHKIFKLF